MLKVDILAAPVTAGSILYGLYDVLRLPGVAWPRAVLGEAGAPLIDVRIIAQSKKAFECRNGVPVSPQASLNDATGADVICIPNMTVPNDQPLSGRFEAEVAWLKARYKAGATIASVCSGALLLAEAGLLDGEEATSHWAYEKMFHDYYPEVTFRPDRVLTFAGEGDRLVLAGGMSSWQDLALYLIMRFLGAEQAAQVSKYYVISDHNEGQLPYAALSRKIQKDDKVIGDCQIWLRDNYAAHNTVARMQEQSGLSRRTFLRRFRAATGYTPIEYVQALRAEEAKQLLETTGAPIEEIAEEIGYQDDRAFRRQFRKRTGLSPSAYRKQFHHARFESAR